MTTKTLKEMGLKPRTIGERKSAIEWVADPDWLELPDITGQDRFVGLVAVNENSTFIAFNVTTSPGTNTVSEGFTVDWGNGTVLDYASGTNVEYLYEFLSTGDYNGVYNQAIISITPKGDDTLLSIDLDVRYTAVTTTHLYSTAWLSIALASPYLTSFNARGSQTRPRMLESVKMRCPNILNYDYMFDTCIGLEYADIDAGNATSFRYTFANCSFTKLPNLVVTSALDLSYMFYNCDLLKSATIFAPSATNLTSMFSYCELLRYLNLNIPAATNLTSLGEFSANLRTLIITSPKATTFSYLAYNCTNLATVDIDVTSANTMYRSFQFCKSLMALPDLHFPVCTSLEEALKDCTNLLDLPKWTFPQATRLNGMLANTNILQSPNWEYPSVTSVSNMFEGCKHLLRIEAYFPSITDVSVLSNIAPYSGVQELLVDSAAGPPLAYRYLTSLLVLPLIDVPIGWSLAGAFQGCSSLLEIPAIDCSNAIDCNNAFQGCSRLIRSRATGIGVSVSFAQTGLSSGAIDEIFTNLSTVSSATITVTGTPGAATCDPSIATSKGWSVTI